MRISTRSTGFAILSLALPCWPQKFHADIPRAWDDKAVEALEVPLAQRDRSPRNLSAEEYLQAQSAAYLSLLPRVYVKGREPAGYLESLKQKESEIIFDPAKLHTKEDWIAAGKLVFESDTGFRPVPSEPPTENEVGFPVSKDGIVAVARYYVRRKGMLELGNNACAGCHTRVMPDGSLWEDAQGAAFVPPNQLFRVQQASSDQFRQIFKFSLDFLRDSVGDKPRPV